MALTLGRYYSALRRLKRVITGIIRFAFDHNNITHKTLQSSCSFILLGMGRDV